MTVAPVEVAAAVAAEVLGGAVGVEVLKDKPGRRRTLRACAAAGTGTVIVKSFASDRAGTVAARVRALGSGPLEPVIPTILHVDRDRRVVVLSDVPGIPLRAAVLAGDMDACRRAGGALAAWHGAWSGRGPDPLRAHGLDRELAILRRQAGTAASPEVARVACNPDPSLCRPWPCTTVVHRDLYEEQLLTGSLIGLIDLDDAHLGPPELDVGNLLAHLTLLGLRSHRGAAASDALVGGYAAEGGSLDPDRLLQCERLSEIRLACIHRLELRSGDPRLEGDRLSLRRE